MRRLRHGLGQEPTIIGVGGISSIMDAELMLDAGADLLQAYTAFIYNGPAWPGRMNRALATGSPRPGHWLIPEATGATAPGRTGTETAQEGYWPRLTRVAGRRQHRSMKQRDMT